MAAGVFQGYVVLLLAFVQRLCGLVHHETRRIYLGLALSKDKLGVLEGGQRFAVQHPALGIFDSQIDRALRHADCRRTDAGTYRVMVRRNDLQSLTGLAYHVLLRDHDVVIVYGVEPRAAKPHLVLTLADSNAGRVRVNDEVWIETHFEHRGLSSGLQFPSV